MFKVFASVGWDTHIIWGVNACSIIPCLLMENRMLVNLLCIFRSSCCLLRLGLFDPLCYNSMLFSIQMFL